jgi:hypothetical protein
MIRFSIILQLCSPRAGSQAEGECFTSENNLQSFSKVKLFLPRRKEALIQFPLERYGYMILTHFFLRCLFVRILSNIHDSEFDLLLNLLPSDYFFFSFKLFKQKFISFTDCEGFAEASPWRSNLPQG